MLVRSRETGEVMTAEEFRAAHPRTSFTKQISKATFEHFNFDVVMRGKRPKRTSVYDHIYEDGVECIDGVWYTAYKIGPVFETLKQEIEHKAAVDAIAAKTVRIERNKKLRESDWTLLSDVPFSAEEKIEWIKYRNALRNLPKLDGFPHNFSWPQQPNS